MNEIYFHIGFHKTGTTWLQNNCFLNTDYFNLLNDHIKPWNDELISYLVTSHPSDFRSETILQIIKPRMKNDKINIVSAERLSGHPYSGGYDTRLIAEKIYKTFPRAKIIIVTRDYSSFIVSTFKQIVKQGYPGSFDNYINRKTWFFPVSTKYYFEHENSVDLYKNLFNANNVLELDFNTFKNNKSAFLDSISKFIKIEQILNIGQHDYIVNKTYPNNRIRAIRFLNRFRKSEYNYYPLINLNIKFINIASIIISPLFSKKYFY